MQISRRDFQVIDRIDRVSRAALGDPSASLQAMSEIHDVIGGLRDRLQRSRPTTRIYSVPFVGSVIVAAGGITPIAKTPVKFAKKGRVIGVKANVREGLTLGTHVTIQVTDQTGYSYFTTGDTDAYVSLAALQGNVYDQGGWSDLIQGDVDNTQVWYVAASSADALPGGGSTSYTPEVLFLVDETE